MVFKKINLVSINNRIFMIMFQICCIGLSSILYFTGQWKNVFWILFFLFLNLLSIFAVFVAFYARIKILSSNEIIFYVFLWFKPKKYRISFDDILEVNLGTKFVDTNVIYVITKDKIIKFTGFIQGSGVTLKGIKKSEIIVKEINQILEEYKKN